MSLKKSLLCIAMLWPVLVGAAAPDGNTRYITDEVSASLRDKPRNDGQLLGVLKSGAQVTLLESLGPDSFARVRTDDGREGWVTARFLANGPAAKDRLAPLQQELAQERDRVKQLERDLAEASGRLAKAAPALELSRENEKLRATIAENEQAGVDLQQRYSREEARRKTLLVGGGLVGGGVLLGLLLPLLGRLRQRRRIY
jgi:SH3 domain protein